MAKVISILGPEVLEQQNPTRGRVSQVSSDTQLNLQPELNPQQQALKEKFGLPERVCTNFDANKERVETFLNDLEKGKFDPGALKKFMLWLCSKFGGQKYEAAVQQFRVKTAAAEREGVFSPKDLLDDLAAAVESCNIKDLPKVLSVTYELLSADPKARRDFFINKLLIPCSTKTYAEIPCLTETYVKTSNKDEINMVKSLIEKEKKFSAINKFCLAKKMTASSEETNEIYKPAPTDEQWCVLISKVMYYAIVSSEGEREKYLQYLQYLQSGHPCSAQINQACLQKFETFNEMNSDLLRCFGNTKEDQITNFKAFVDGLRDIAAKVQTEHSDDKEKAFMSRASAFLIDNPELMWEALKMQEMDLFLWENLFLGIVQCQAKCEDKSKILSSATLQAMTKAAGNESSDFSNLTDEQVKLLCGGINLSELLKDEQVIETNKNTIDMVLKFVQDKALQCTDPKISFEDLMPEIVKNKTCQRLLKFVEDESSSYDQELKNFIRNGVEQRLAQMTAPG
ncbi:MAG: hypothetical protein LBD34_03960 [Puniceicoccales bacterium]|jgi:hypothetical protein|nr:hypothetical protein [Puniceicoccales bacterium]